GIPRWHIGLSVGLVCPQTISGQSRSWREGVPDMRIIHNSGADRIDLGTIEIRHCEFCQQQRPFNAWVHSTSQGVSWIFLRVPSCAYHLICQSCQRGFPVETHEVGTLAWDLPIPFWRKHGVLVFFAFLALLLLVCGVMLLVERWG